MLALYSSEALLLDALGGETVQRTPLWEAHAEKFFDWGQEEFDLYSLEGFFAELEAFLRPTV